MKTSMFALILKGIVRANHKCTTGVNLALKVELKLAFLGSPAVCDGRAVDGDLWYNLRRQLPNG